MVTTEKSIYDRNNGNVMDAMQSMMGASSAVNTKMKHFWQAQEQFLNVAEEYSLSWFKRRHEGTTTAIELASKLAQKSMSDPVQAMQLMREWQTHSIERVTQDAKECSEMLTSATDCFLYSDMQAIDAMTKKAKSEKK